MACQSKPRMVGDGVKWDTGGPIKISEEDREKLITHLEETRQEGIRKLRESGAAVEFCSSAQQLRLIFDSCEIVNDEEGNIQILVDGKPISEDVQLIQVRPGRGNFTKIMVTFSPILMRKPE